MSAYATVADVAARLGRALSQSENSICESLLAEATEIIDQTGTEAQQEAKRAVSVRMVARAIGTGAGEGIPVGATQGTISALGYSQSWTVGSGTVGELYLGKQDKQLLGLGNRIGSASPVEDLAGGGIECAAFL